MFDKSFQKPVTNTNSVRLGLELRSVGNDLDRKHIKEISTYLTYNIEKNVFSENQSRAIF